MEKEIITTVDAPEAIGPYSQAIKAGNFVFTAGQIALNPSTQKIVEGGIKEQTEQVMRNLRAILEKAKLTFEDVVKVDVFLTELENFSEMNEIYSLYFSQAEPARTTVIVKDLPKGSLVEISLIAIE
ncbi:MAG: RidA family protein [Candidatus Cloacimonadota bacterium]|nr:MAG: RidA family protein [Candidatus Cloacimonadota bacterium]